MDVKTFVAENLNQIISAIQECQNKNAVSKINPAPLQADEINITQIEFDIAVTLENETGKNAGIAVLGGAIKLGGQTAAKKTDVSVSRIKFSVPVAFRTTSHSVGHTI